MAKPWTLGEYLQHEWGSAGYSSCIIDYLWPLTIHSTHAQECWHLMVESAVAFSPIAHAVVFSPDERAVVDAGTVEDLSDMMMCAAAAYRFAG